VGIGDNSKFQKKNEVQTYNPHWFSLINQISSENPDSLAFKTAVNSFPKQLTIVIGL
jgi:hypothetical protein